MNDFPRVAPPADGLALAMATARSRRLRKASASSGVSALALTMVAVLAGTSGRSTLTQQPTPEQPAVIVQVVPDGQQHTNDQGTRPNVVSPLAGSGTGSGSVTALSRPSGPGSSAGFTPSDKDTTGSSSRKELPSVPYKAGPIQRTDNGLALPTCGFQGDGRSYTVCPSATVQTAGEDPGHYGFYSDVCNSDAQVFTLHFDTANEIDFAVYRGGKEVWRWSEWHAPRAAAHTAQVGTGACMSWTFSWTGVDRSGERVPPGEYVLRTENLSDEMTARTIDDTSFTVS